MSQRRQKKTVKVGVKSAFSRFAPASFLAASPLALQSLCEELTRQIAGYFAERSQAEWKRVATSVAQELRMTGHDLSHFDESEALQEWQAEWHHPRGTFVLRLVFRESGEVEVTLRTDDSTFTSRAVAG